MNGITLDDLKEQFQRHEGLIENLSLSIGNNYFTSNDCTIIKKN